MVRVHESDPRTLEAPTNDELGAGLRHESFFRALASLGGHEGEREWRALLAGLVTLRLADRRLGHSEGEVSHTPRLAPANGWTADIPPAVIEAARSAVADVDDREAVALPLRDLCRSATAVVTSDIPQQLLAYANALHADSRWPLAADVYRMVLRLADSPRLDGTFALQSLVPHVYDRLGRSLRMMGDVDGARAAYQVGREVARGIGDLIAEQLIRISQAKVLMHVGNLPAAGAALDDIIRDAMDAKTPPHALGSVTEHTASSALCGISDHLNALALAHHDRAVVASRQRDFNLAAEEYYAAWRGYRGPAHREAVCADFAESLAEMGRFDAARDALTLLYRVAHSREVRLLAATNLLELAVLDQREDLFDVYRRTLRDAARAATLPAEVAAKFALYEGRGEIRFGRRDAALSAFERALELATVHRVHEVTIRADEALAALRSGVPVAKWSPPVAPTTVFPAVDRITRAVGRVRRRRGAPRHG
jgi:tetratricopeptide (TPR) repeat protein